MLYLILGHQHAAIGIPESNQLRAPATLEDFHFVWVKDAVGVHEFLQKGGGEVLALELASLHSLFTRAQERLQAKGSNQTS